MTRVNEIFNKIKNNNVTVDDKFFEEEHHDEVLKNAFKGLLLGWAGLNLFLVVKNAISNEFSNILDYVKYCYNDGSDVNQSQFLNLVQTFSHDLDEGMEEDVDSFNA